MSDKELPELSLPVIALRDVVVYPHMVIPLFVGREESINALERAVEKDQNIFLLAQKDANVDAPTSKDLYRVGTVATILQMLRLPDGTIKVLVEGLGRAKAVSVAKRSGFFTAKMQVIEEPEVTIKDLKVQVLVRRVVAEFENLIKTNKKIPGEVMTALNNIEDVSRLADTIAAHISVKVQDRQSLLETINLRERLQRLFDLLHAELELVEVDQKIQTRVKDQVEKNQKQYYLNEKLKAIQSELGEMDDSDGYDEIKKFEAAIAESGMPKEAMEKATAELNKLKMMPPMSAEATVCRNYLDWLVGVPWKERTKVSKDLHKAQEVLDSEHHGLEKVKERILEYLAVQQRVDKLKGPILCLVGPPGVGKTSLGRSIAEATGREFARISLGGVRDEAEIRGHRRTYVGAMPGKIVQRLTKVKVRNPLFMLDEIDKMAADFRGDPASALLEVLDPEQNHAFGDHYLEVDYDLSDVMFIATSNSMNIPPALLDRMEVIRLAGYTETEKLNIATKYLLKRQIEQSGLKKSELKISDAAVLEIIRSYTREAGVRNLERELSKICRKVVKEILLDPKCKKVSVTQRNLEKYLGVTRFHYGVADSKNRIGQVAGLAWTQVGGELLTIEVQTVPGKGKSTYTGSLGDVMQESIHAAMTVMRSRATTLGITDKYFQRHDFHVHVPEGATPKDGPSAGVGMCVALVSAVAGIPVKASVAMTGEITLRGEVLPIGGLKEKLLGALRAGITDVIIPEENARELKEMPEEVLEAIQVHPIKWVDQAWEIALERLPKPLTKKQLAQLAKDGVNDDDRISTH